MIKILCVEDDELLIETLEDFLTTKDYEVTCVMGGKEAIDICYNNKFDLYILDINLPDINGLECLKLLRDSEDNTPSIFLTSATDKDSLEKGFCYGADDYIKKPFDLDELNLRIQAVLSRSGCKDKIIQINSTFSINPARKSLLKNDKEFKINQKDFELLMLLLQHKGSTVTKNMIYNKLWCMSECVNEGAIRVYINNLKKIFGKNSIQNIRGVGYRFEIA